MTWSGNSLDSLSAVRVLTENFRPSRPHDKETTGPIALTKNRVCSGTPDHLDYRLNAGKSIDGDLGKQQALTLQFDRRQAAASALCLLPGWVESGASRAFS